MDVFQKGITLDFKLVNSQFPQVFIDYSNKKKIECNVDGIEYSLTSQRYIYIYYKKIVEKIYGSLSCFEIRFRYDSDFRTKGPNTYFSTTKKKFRFNFQVTNIYYNIYKTYTRTANFSLGKSKKRPLLSR